MIASRIKSSGSSEASSISQNTSLLSKDTIYHILQVQRRRLALEYLQGTNEPVKMADLAEYVAACEHNTTVELLSSNERQRTYISLYQSHLPLLDEENIISYNQSRGIVERSEAAKQIDPYLQVNKKEDEPTDREDNDHRWAYYYFGIVLISLILLLINNIGNYISSQMLLSSIVFSFGTLTIIYKYYTKSGY